jgi:hypothetical protein
MTRKSGDCKPVRENGSAYCNSNYIRTFPEECLNLHMEYTSYACRGCNRSPMCCRQGWRQNPASSLSRCMERQHDFDGTAADPRMPRRLYDLALNQETVIPSAYISGAIIPMTAQLTWRPQFGSFGFMCEISRIGMHYLGRKSQFHRHFSTAVIYASTSSWMNIGNQAQSENCRA